MINQQQINHFFELFETAYPGGMEPERFFRDEPYALEMLYLALSSNQPELVAVAEWVKRQRSDALRPRRTAQMTSDERARAEAALQAAQTDAARQATSGANEEKKHSPSRRTRNINLQAEDILVLSKIASGFRRVLGIRLDVDEFARNDIYARTVLKLCVTSGNDELVSLSLLFLDELGNPMRHRRGKALDLTTDLT
jgi:hypothetical protein